MILQYNKIENLRLAIAQLDGIVVYPGETFSFWRLVGRPTYRKGYKTGLTLFNGQVTSGCGGGLCQLGNLLFWMLLHTPLTVTERWRHSFDVFPDVNRTLPFGSGATLAYNYIDLQFRNTTEQRYQVKLYLTDTHLCGSIHADNELPYAYTVYEKEHYIRQQQWGGYTRHNRLFRRQIRKHDDSILADEPMVQNHAIMMYEPLLHPPTSVQNPSDTFMPDQDQSL